MTILCAYSKSRPNRRSWWSYLQIIFVAVCSVLAVSAAENSPSGSASTSSSSSSSTAASSNGPAVSRQSDAVPSPGSGASVGARVPLTRKDRVANLNTNSAALKALLESQISYGEGLQKRGATILKVVRDAREKESRESAAAAAPLYKIAADVLEPIIAQYPANSWRIVAAECYRKANNPNKLDEARKHLLAVLQDPFVEPNDVAAAAAELRNLALVPNYKLEITAQDIAGVEREVAKIFADLTSGGTLDLSSPQPLLRAGELFLSNGDTVWAAQMFRRCLTIKAKRGDPTFKEATAKLKALNLNPLAPPLRYTRKVAEDYLVDPLSTNVSTSYLEEVAPKISVWDRIEKRIRSTHFADTNKVSRVQPDDIEKFENAMRPVLGADFQWFKHLFLEGFCYILKKNTGITYSSARDFCIQKSFTPLNLDPNDFPPLVNAATPGEAGLGFVGFYQHRMSVEYLKSDEARKPYKLSVNGQGLLLQNGALFDTTNMSTVFSGKGWAIYVVTPDGDIYAATHKLSAFHHSSLLAAADVAGAGELQVTKGKIVSISNKSGHYLPGMIHLVQTLDALKTMKADTTGLTNVLLFGEGPRSSVKWNGDAASFRSAWNDLVQFKSTFSTMGFVNDPTPDASDYD